MTKEEEEVDELTGAMLPGISTTRELIAAIDGDSKGPKH